MNQSATRLPLSEIAPGNEIRLAGFSGELAPSQCEQLLAYGLSLEAWVRVVQQHPMTMIRVDETELALEREISSKIWVEISRA